MRFLRRFLARLKNFATRGRDDKRLREEMEEHLALQTAENLRGGMAPAEARRQAVLKFGATQAIREDYHSERGLPFFENLLQDVRFSDSRRAVTFDRLTEDASKVQGLLFVQATRP